MDNEKTMEMLKAMQQSLQFQFQSLAKAVDDVLWYEKLGDIAKIDKVKLTGPPPQNTTAQSPQKKGNPVVFASYTFIHKDADPNEKYPLLVYVHGGVHSNFGSASAGRVRELLEQGYIVVAPDYRGSTGYGKEHWELIDYGGLEVEDAYAARNWAVENLDQVDPERVGILGWSHGGLITLFNIFNHPESYKVAYAGVPVSDLVARMGYKGPGYHSLFAADYHIGKTAYQDPWAYRQRSPAWHAEKLQTPLLIHTTTNDEDVNVLEVEHLIKALKAHGKEFKYKIYENAPGGHGFCGLDTKFSYEIRKEIYKHLAEYLSPPNPIG